MLTRSDSPTDRSRSDSYKSRRAGGVKPFSLTNKPNSAFSSTSVNSNAPNFFNIITEYMDRVVPSDDKMKVLLVDEFTINILSTSLSQTTLLHKNVFLVDQITTTRQRTVLKNMQCVIFIRPQLSSVEAACAELRLAKYEMYVIVFCGATSPDQLERLARADVDKLVQRVEEVFCDFDAVNSDAFLTEVYPASGLLSSFVANVQIKRIAEGLASCFVARRRRPFIRFQANSDLANRVASWLSEITHNDSDLYNYPPRETVLLILDRSDDPISALLTPWTYQAMLHEHIGLHHNTLHLPREVKGADENGYVFSQQDDYFFAQNMFANWGDLCNNVKAYVEQCKVALNIDRTTATMEELREFMQNIPHTKTLAGSASKHTTVTSHLANIIKSRDLLEVSLLEQDMVSSSNSSDHWSRLESLAARSETCNTDLVRLCLIYYLRYERGNEESRTLPLLRAIDNNTRSSLYGGTSHANIIGNNNNNNNYKSQGSCSVHEFSSTHKTSVLLRKLRDYYGQNKSTEGLFGDTGVLSSIVKTFVDVGNIYTQHEPKLKRTLNNLFSGKLDEAKYPYWEQHQGNSNGNTSRSNLTNYNLGNNVNISSNNNNNVGSSTNSMGMFKAREVMVFMCGGYTFEEAALINAINNGKTYKPSEQNVFVPGGVTASIGAECILNTTQFLDLLSRIPES